MEIPPRPPACRKGLRVDGKQEINLEWPYDSFANLEAVQKMGQDHARNLPSHPKKPEVCSVIINFGGVVV